MKVPAVFNVMAVLALHRIGIVADGYVTAPDADIVVPVNAPVDILSSGIVAVLAVLLSSV